MDSVGFMVFPQLSQRRFFSRDFYLALLITLVLGGAVFGYVHYLRVITPPDEETYIPRSEVITPEIELLQRYVRIDTSNPPGRELEAAQFLAGILREGGVAAELIESAPGRANVYARIAGRKAGEGLLLLHHIDVVPARPSEWKRPPFAAEVFFNQLWGRGALDMKGIGVCHLRAFLDVARSGVQPERDLIFLATADEEAGGRWGLAWLLKHRPDVIAGVGYAINEGGIPEMRGEKLMYFGVEVGSKQFMKVRLRASSRETLQQARIALEPYIHPHDPERLLPEVRQFMKVIAPHRIQGSALLEDVDAAIAEGNFWLLNISFRALTQNNIIPLGIENEPEGFGLDVFLHNLPDERPEARLAHLRKLVDPFKISVELKESMGPTTISSTSTALFRDIVQSVRKVYGRDCAVGPLILAYQTNDNRYLRAAGIQAYGLSPFLFDFHQSEGIHARDERVRLDWLLQGVELTQQIVRAHAYGADN